MSTKGFESEFISSWEDWDEPSPFCMAFMYVVLAVQIGPFEPGTKLNYFLIDLETKKIVIQNMGEDFEFELIGRVGERIK